jgi:heme-degrading monooxygenase HmoA
MERTRSPFASLAPTGGGYATLPIAEAFTWDRSTRGLEPGEWYLVAFRSVLSPTADHAVLWEHDRRAHQEARRQPGFVHYFHGEPNERRQCLSFCLWESRPHAREAAKGSAHLEAVALVAEMYESYVLEFHWVRKRQRATGLEFESYDLLPTG